MYDFLTGPFVWVTFILFLGGSIYKIVTMLRLAKQEKVIYPFMEFKYSFRSIVHWIVPFASLNMRLRPVMTVVTFGFHLSLLLTPIFLVAHNILWQKAWGFSLWTIPEVLADIMTVIVIFGCLFFLMRRILAPEVKNVTSISDIILLLVVVLPFITGFIAHHQWIAYKPMLTLHVLFGEIMLIAIPFTRLSHMLYFFFTRAFMGCEFGAVRNARDW